MAFDTPNGTRGARSPAGTRLERWGNQRMAEHIRRKGDRRGNKLALVTIGRKTGRERVTPVRWFPEGDGARLIVASANGAAKNPSWYYNIAAHPDRVRIEFAGKRIDVTAEQLHGAERAAAWAQITSTAHGFARYERVTDREIPVIRLTPRRTPRTDGAA
ncbi:nitroreductase/quinone reductase family protein [Agromyces sp. H3Y2-19a]|jgi:deazaflavin-dependent oxidoreductase (nitroreductase family)|uniref:nitroreductase/quinone reductase family protein n=1 Tax=Agromyces TaxID=33877 RepID=UPI001E49D335|nr:MULTISPECIES: nitroreductase/quinone reductase family protein [Agromyces]MCD5348127.1 nitroreductase/quinone reductase family protein [Agromyces sp. S2-1-8]MDF0514269.1 nitroreductase/quinone reductase family protein [Agromyces chromiiresistens]